MSNAEPFLYLIRGLPGSGKSTLAQAMVKAGLVNMHIETDIFRYRGANYVFVPEESQTHHLKCEEATLLALLEGKSVVVSNTFIRLWEMKPYFDMGYPIHVITCQGMWGNIHGVSDATIERMRSMFEHIPQ